jgi:GNAT superfamily N-acetyltransferase
MTPKRFTEEIDNYTVLLLDLDKYQAPVRRLPDGFEFLDPARHGLVRDQERRLLQKIFEDWNIPYCGKLCGWRADSPVFVMRADQLVGGVYLCDENEFDSEPARGQLHYFFIHPSFRVQGIHSANVREAVDRARAWGLNQVYVNTDRYLLAEVYIRWGAKRLKRIEKSSRLPHNTFGKLARRLRWQARRVWQDVRKPCL